MDRRNFENVTENRPKSQKGVNMPLKIVRNDITKMHTQAIVNTANEQVAVGPGCDKAVYDAAGFEELFAYRKEKVGVVPEGEVFITPGFGLKAKYIIHAVSPLYKDGNQGEEEKLRLCYRRSLELARKNAIRSVAFPLIATGSYGYPKEEGMRIAVDEINAFLLQNRMQIYIVVFDEKATMLGRSIYPDLEEYIDRRYEEETEIRGILANRFEAMHLGKAERNCFCESIEAFEEAHDSKLEERLRHLSDTFSEYLLYLIEEKEMDSVDVYKRAIVDKKTFSKLKNDSHYHPNKLTALCLCVGAKLNLDETKDLLARAGYALSPCDKTDIIFSYFIENEIYDMIELDIQLEEHGERCIIS